MMKPYPDSRALPVQRRVDTGFQLSGRGVEYQYYVRRYGFTGKHLTRIELDPDHGLLDVNRANKRVVRPAGLVVGATPPSPGCCA